MNETLLYILVLFTLTFGILSGLAILYYKGGFQKPKVDKHHH